MVCCFGWLFPAATIVFGPPHIQFGGIYAIKTWQA